MKIRVKSWITPNYVTAEAPPNPRQNGCQAAPKWHLQDVDAETLSELCDRFRAEVFEKAGKPDPQKNSVPNISRQR